MLTLALIPAFALVAMAMLALHIFRAYQHKQEQLRSDDHAKRNQILSDDGNNDEQVVVEVVTGTKTVGDLFSEYRSARHEIAPDVNRKDPGGWTPDDLDEYLACFQHGLLSKEGRRLLHRAALFALLIVSVSGVTAAVRYNQLSNPTASPTAVQNQLTSLPADPFAALSSPLP